MVAQKNVGTLCREASSKFPALPANLLRVSAWFRPWTTDPWDRCTQRPANGRRGLSHSHPPTKIASQLLPDAKSYREEFCALSLHASGIRGNLSGRKLLLIERIRASEIICIIRDRETSLMYLKSLVVGQWLLIIIDICRCPVRYD